jgi:dipeptidyl aminopeptidase/acylaminoacyl peptidase
MRTRATVLALSGSIVLGLTSASLLAQSGANRASGYMVPPKAIVDILDAEPLPIVVVSPAGDTIAVMSRRSMPSIEEVSQPMLRLAGIRINPKTNGLHRAPSGTAITLRSIATGSERKIAVPPNARLGALTFSPDGKRFSFTNTRDTRIDLYLGDVATGQTRMVDAALNDVSGACRWLDDASGLLCGFVPGSRSTAPAQPKAPSGPNVQENYGKTAPGRTYQDLLASAYDEDLFEYYFTNQLAFVNAADARRTPVGKPTLVAPTWTLSPDARYILVERIKRPFSRLLPWSEFPTDVEVWSRNGDKVRSIADVPMGDVVPIRGVHTGPRAYRWHPLEPATLVWVEALDQGDLKNKVPNRDRVLTLQAPFAGDAREVARTEYRFGGASWTDAGTILLTEDDRATRTTRTWIMNADWSRPRKLWDRKQQDAYSNPGSPVLRPGKNTILQTGDAIYLTGAGSSPEGDRPFLDRLNLKTLAAERLFRSDAASYESVVRLMDDGASRVLTRHETRVQPPNYAVRDLKSGTKRAITEFKDPHPQITSAERTLVTYTRKDGVALNGTVYLPIGHKKGERSPMLVWAYPREFVDADAAGQVTGSPNRFTTVGGASHLLLLTQGYAVFDGPTMPIVGPGETANDTYVDQLVASAAAAIDKAVDMGVADRQRIAVGGHSYGAFMTANLLAHSDLFAAGIARSGAYNRTLTPFGFQAETRTFWEIPQIYERMSPFWYAHNIKEPILLIHGEADDNSGTFPIQSERLYMALKGHGATVRYVTLPNEAHGYAARESNLHTVAEMLNWLDKYVKNAQPRKTTDSVSR